MKTLLSMKRCCPHLLFSQIHFCVMIRLFCVWLHLKLQLYCHLTVKQLILDFIFHLIVTNPRLTQVRLLDQDCGQG